MSNLDKIDLRILELLQDNAKISNQELADSVALSPSQCWRRVRQLESTHIISSYTTLLNPKQLNLNITALIHVALDNHHQDTVDEFEHTIESWPQIQECHSTSGDYDFFMKVVATDMEAYETFLMTKLLQLPYVRTVNTSFSLRQKKYTTKLPL